MTSPALRHALLVWYDANRRALPWRKTRDPYRIWISEIMLQQTRVAVVIDRYKEFVRRFPTVQKLAAAPESSVLAEWSGLGYYRRARNLHAAAKIIARENKFPRTAEALRVLPGIGRYTAAAIASIAFNEPVAVVDGNVERVLTRVLGSTLAQEELWDAAQSILDPARPGDSNQAMMELGATVCLPRQPQCQACQIRKFCRTRGTGEPTKLRLLQQKKEITYLLNRRADSVLLIQRSKSESLMPGMWELPEVAAPKAADAILFSLRHSITVTNYAVRVAHIRPPRRSPERSRRGSRMGLSPATVGQWIRISRINTLPLTGLARKILRTAKIIQ
jgi:A/G-specific adenine glycosylase